jgi:hypothetical protein
VGYLPSVSSIIWAKEVADLLGKIRMTYLYLSPLVPPRGGLAIRSLLHHLDGRSIFPYPVI